MLRLRVVRVVLLRLMQLELVWMKLLLGVNAIGGRSCLLSLKFFILVLGEYVIELI